MHLLGKKLLVLPIDDVDTSLNRAFENLEIIRRYMTTPYVLPIVSGDRALYHEVTWRDFHGRLIKDSDYLAESAYERSLELAEEYQRKILPFPRRLTMPAVSSYWQQTDIYLRSEKFGDIMPLRNFIAWLEIFISGPVNGQEDSRIILPIPSIRSLTQLIGHCSSFIALLPDAIRTAKNELEVRRVWQMPTVPLEVIAAFQDKHKELSEKSKREYTDAYKLFTEKMKELSPVDYSFDKVENDNKNNITKNDLAVKMADYFRFESKAGAVYLVLIAKQYWQNWTNTDSLVRQGSIFDTPLFQPLTHNTANLAFFDKTSDLSAWASALEERLPEEWLIGLKSHQTILPYPVAEVGINAATAWDYQGMIERIVLNDEGKKKATFLINLLVQYNFYTNAKQTMLLNIGRIFELIISSIAGPISREDLQTILSRAPFFSTRALAPTKTLLIDYLKTENRSTTGVQNITGEAETVAEPSDEFDPIVVLQNDIDNWRKEHNLEQVELSPWLVYKVFNKVYSQLASNEKIPSGMKNVGIAMNMVAHTFYATWSAFGSFEKGELFGLPNVVATTNLNADKLNNFEKNDHFNINVGPFAPSNSQIENDNEPYQIRSTYGKSTRTISYCLAEHPLRKWIDELIEVEWPSARTAKQVLLEELNLPETDRIPWTKIELQLKDDPDSARELLENLEAQFGVNDIIVKNLKTRLTKLHPENNS